MVYILNRKYKGPLAPLLDRHWNKYHLCVWLPGTHESTFVILSAFQILWNYPYLTIIIVFFWYTQMINMFRATNELPWYRTASRSPEPLLFIQEKGQKSPHKKSIAQLDHLYFNIQRKENYTPPHSRRNVDANSIVRWMFWSDWGRVPKIERAGMDGSHRSFEWNLEKFVIIFIVGRSSFKAVFDGLMVLLLIWFLTGISMKISRSEFYENLFSDCTGWMQN